MGLRVEGSGEVMVAVLGTNDVLDRDGLHPLVELSIRFYELRDLIEGKEVRVLPTERGKDLLDLGSSAGFVEIA